MQIAVEQCPGASVVSAFLETFAGTAEKAGYRVLSACMHRSGPARIGLRTRIPTASSGRSDDLSNRPESDQP